MLRQRRRRLYFTSDSSDDGALLPKKQLKRTNRTCSQSDVALHFSGTRKRHRESQEDNDCSSDNSFVLPPRKHWKKFPISTSEESSTSDDEDISRPAKRGAVRALSDYETGDSSDKVSEASACSSSSRTNCDRTNLNGKSSEADSSDSGIPIGLGRPRNHRRFPVSSEESDSPELVNGETSVVQSRGRRRGNTAMEDCVRPATSRNRLVQQTRRGNSNQLVVSNSRRRTIHHAQSEDEFSSDSTTTTSDESDCSDSFDEERNRRVTRNERNGAVSYNKRRTVSRRNRTIQHSRRSTRSRNNDQIARPNRRPALLSRESAQIPQADEEELSSDSIIRPVVLGQCRIIDVSSSETSSSDENDDENIPVRRGARIPIHESDEDMGSPNISVTYNADSVVTADGTKAIVNLANSSDSDGENEKCPICLARFGAQEVGIPSSCDHSFCLTCIQEWAKNKNTCPVDRLTFSSLDVRDNIHSRVSHRVKVETPLAKTFLVTMGLLENIAASLYYASDANSESESYDLIDSDEICCVCQQSNNTSNMIICDFCSSVYHLRCLNPPLHSVPARTWYCPRCE